MCLIFSHINLLSSACFSRWLKTDLVTRDETMAKPDMMIAADSNRYSLVVSFLLSVISNFSLWFHFLAHGFTFLFFRDLTRIFPRPLHLKQSCRVYPPSDALISIPR